MVEQEKKLVATQILKSDVSKKQSAMITEPVAPTAASIEVDSLTVESQAVSGMAEQFRTLKQDLSQGLDSIKSQLLNSQKSLIELGNFAKTEVNGLVDELTKLVNEFKVDISEISTKHKEQLTETLKRSKESGLEAWHKVKQ